MSDTKTLPKPATSVAKKVFWPAAVVVLVFVAFAVIVPDTAEAFFAAIQTFRDQRI